MKKKLTIYFDETGEEETFKLYAHIMEMHTSLWQINDYIRLKLKHADLSEKEEEHLETIREMIYLPEVG